MAIPSPQNPYPRLFHARPLTNHVWDGKIIYGDESVETLRVRALAMADACPRGLAHERCPFRWLETLARGQREELINHLDRNALLQMFAMEQACRFEAEHPRGSRPPMS